MQPFQICIINCVGDPTSLSVHFSEGALRAMAARIIIMRVNDIYSAVISVEINKLKKKYFSVTPAAFKLCSSPVQMHAAREQTIKLEQWLAVSQSLDPSTCAAIMILWLGG